MSTSATEPEGVITALPAAPPPRDARRAAGTAVPTRPSAGERAAATLREWYATATTRRVSPHGTAALRIGYGLAYLVYLLRELPERGELWGPGAAWSPAMDRSFAAAAGWPGWVRTWYTLLATSSGVRFDLSYATALLICVGFVAGFRTRATSVLFMLVVTGFQGRDVFVTDGGDNILVLMAIYLVFVDSGRHWSVDASRARRRLRDGAASLPPVRAGVLADLSELRRRTVTLLHNAAVLAVAFQMCLVYGAAGLYKVQGSMWQQGTALYYTLHLSWFRPWPGLSDWFGSHATAIAVVGYVTVFVQIGFPFALFNRRLKYVFLVVLLGMHLGIAVLLGLPLFSATMVIGDSVFLPERCWLTAARLLRTGTSRRLPWRRQSRSPSAGVVHEQ